MLELPSERAAELAAEAVARGLVVTLPDGGFRPIPTSLRPTVRRLEAIDEARGVANAVARAGLAFGRASWRGALPDVVRGALSPLEHHLAEQTADALDALAVTRVDFFDGVGLAALELNATIPAMQHYGDAAAAAWRAVAERAGVLAPSAGPSNLDALVRVLASAGAARLGRPPERLAILARPQDAQIAELHALAARWPGGEARIVFPADIERRGATWMANGWPFDLVYRHLFVRRLEDPHLGPIGATVDLLADPGPGVAVLNPPASHVEVKAVFALLSEAVLDPRMAERAGVTDADMAVVKRVVPWTRRLLAGPATTPDGPVRDVLAWVAAQPERFVLKRSWDYGGRAVFVGAATLRSGYQDRVRAMTGKVLSWPELVDRCARDPAGGGFVVQERVEARREPHLIATPDGVVPLDCVVDLSVYASPGYEDPRWGAVVRASTDDVVNIVGGGGVIPLLVTP